MTESVHVEITVAAPTDVVWGALRDRAQLRRWFGWEYDGIAAEIEEIFFTGATVDEAGLGLDTGGGRLVLEPAGGSTVLRVLREDPAGGGWDGRYDGIDHGWLTFAQQLRFALERHPGRDRRTIHLSGEPQVLAAQPVDELGLAGVGLLAAGAPYATPLATGERIDGEVWFSDRGQLGLTVSGYGDGLLVLFGDWTGEPPYGQTAIVVSTFGLADAAFARTEARWTRWWWAHHSQPPQSTTT